MGWWGSFMCSREEVVEVVEVWGCSSTRESMISWRSLSMLVAREACPGLGLSERPAWWFPLRTECPSEWGPL